MNSREIEQLKKKSIYSLKLNPKIKDSLVQIESNNLVRFLKQSSKRKTLTVYVLETDD